VEDAGHNPLMIRGSGRAPAVRLLGAALLAAGASMGIVFATSAARPTGRAVAMTHVQGVWFLTPMLGFVQTNVPQRLLMTTDGGGLWVDVSPPALRLAKRYLASGLAGSAFQSRSRFWIAVSRSSEQGEVPVELLHTTDAGRSWIDDGSFPRAYGYAWIEFLTPSRGWLMVDNGAAMDQDPVTIYQTDSGGALWTELAQSPIQTITNGTPGAPSPRCDKTGISFSSATSGWIAGDCTANALLQHTGDGGRHWQVVPLACPDHRADCGGSTSPPQFFGAKDGALSAELYSPHGFAIVIYTTVNAGKSWVAHATPAHSQGAQVDILSGSTWLVGESTALYTTTDAGQHWSKQPTGIQYSPSIAENAFDFLTPTDGWAITQAGQLWHTTTGGRTWRTLRIRP